MFSTKYVKEEKLWYGPEIPPLYNPKISLARGLLEAMTTFGPKIAQINDNTGIKMTFNEIKMKTIRAAQNLQHLEYKPKQVFTIIAKNSHHVAPIAFASIAIGCAVNSLDTSFGKTELVHMFEITRPNLMFCDVACYELVSECFKELQIEAKIFTFGGSVGQSEPVEVLFEETHHENQFLPVHVDGSNDTAMIVCSSGTTGLPKGICLSHAALLDGTTQYKVTDCSDVMLSFSSLYWISGLGTLITGTLCGATRIITTEPFSPELQLRLIEQYKVSYVFNAVHQAVLMVRSEQFKRTDTSSLKHLVTGGSKVPLQLKTLINQHLPNGSVYVVYGMSEISNAISLDFPHTAGKDTFGRLVGGCCVKIADESGNRCNVNEDGEICVKLNTKFLGYLNNQKETDAVFDSEGFLLTGDIGHFDEDGDLFIVDRKKDLIRYCGFQISPVAIDEYLAQCPGIRAACLVGIPEPAVTDLPAVAIIRAEGSNISEQEVFDLIANHFSDYCKLRGGVYFVDSFPRTPSGKVKRGEVKKLAIQLYNARKH